MDIYVLNKSFQTIGIIDIFESMIWTDRYYGFGDFELYTSVDVNLLSLLQVDNYLKIKDSDRLMIIEDIEVITNVESGNKLKFSGRSLESILDRRIVMQQTQLTGSLQTAVQTLLNNAMISPLTNAYGIPTRQVSNMIFQTNSSSAITSLVMEGNYFGEYIYDIVQSLCEYNKIGFKIILNTSNQFVFSLYAGANRSYSQSSNSYVIFSSDFDNLLNSNYFESKRPYKTADIAFGDASDGITPLAYGWIFGGAELVGIDHRELFVDASSVSKFVNGTPINSTTYLDQIRQFANETRHANSNVITSFDGQVEPNINFKYGVDYFIGDLVQLKSEYGFTGQSRVTEVTISENLNGYYVFPTFKV